MQRKCSVTAVLFIEFHCIYLYENYYKKKKNNLPKNLDWRSAEARRHSNFAPFKLHPLPFMRHASFSHNPPPPPPLPSASTWRHLAAGEEEWPSSFPAASLKRRGEALFEFVAAVAAASSSSSPHHQNSFDRCTAMRRRWLDGVV